MRPSYQRSARSAVAALIASLLVVLLLAPARAQTTGGERCAANEVWNDYTCECDPLGIRFQIRDIPVDLYGDLRLVFRGGHIGTDLKSARRRSSEHDDVCIEVEAECGVAARAGDRRTRRQAEEEEAIAGSRVTIGEFVCKRSAPADDIGPLDCGAHFATELIRCELRINGQPAFGAHVIAVPGSMPAGRRVCWTDHSGRYQVRVAGRRAALWTRVQSTWLPLGVFLGVGSQSFRLQTVEEHFIVHSADGAPRAGAELVADVGDYSVLLPVSDAAGRVQCVLPTRATSFRVLRCDTQAPAVGERYKSEDTMVVVRRGNQIALPANFDRSSSSSAKNGPR